jgi:hypothetical protein
MRGLTVKSGTGQKDRLRAFALHKTICSPTAALSDSGINDRPEESFGSLFPTTQIILATLAPHLGERNFYEICRATILNYAPTEWRWTHAISQLTPEAGAPEDESAVPRETVNFVICELARFTLEEDEIEFARNIISGVLKRTSR